LRPLFRPVFFRGTFAPFARASDSPIAIACFRLLTFRPLPDFSVPFFRRFMALSTRLLAALPYFRRPDFLRPPFFAAMWSLPRKGNDCDDGMDRAILACIHVAAEYAVMHRRTTGVSRSIRVTS
jgi:hypothetical protein